MVKKKCVYSLRSVSLSNRKRRHAHFKNSSCLFRIRDKQFDRLSSCYVRVEPLSVNDVIMLSKPCSIVCELIIQPRIMVERLVFNQFLRSCRILLPVLPTPLVESISSSIRFIEHWNDISRPNVIFATPSRTPSRNPISPSRQKSTEKVVKKTPNNLINKHLRDGEGDRFIPSRVSTDINRAHHALCKDENTELSSEDKIYQRAVTESLNTINSNSKILHYKFGVRDSGSQNCMTKTASPVQKEMKKRLIRHMPEKVLDAPEIVDDFYLNILDWSQSNILAIALAQEVYLWNAVSGDITCLMNTGFENEYVTSLRWSPEVPNVLAVGLSAGRVQLWDASSQTLTRTMRLGGTGSAARVPAVSWRDYLITSGSRTGHIRHHDTRMAHHEVGINDFHTQEVCGLAWSPDKRFLAAGSNDNCVSLWSSNDVSSMSGATPTQVLREHHAATKALAWCPWKPSLLCTGGGAADHSLNFWNASTGSCIKSVDVSSQVSGIIWNSEFREILTSHGDPKNQLSIWKYPEITKVADLSEHQGRVLCVVSSPNDELVASCAADETLRIWHCFEVDKCKKRVDKPTVRSVYTKGIR